MNLSARVEQLRSFQQREGRAPSYAEMMKIFGYGSKNAVYGVVNRLVKEGYVKRLNNGRIQFTSRLKGGVPMLGSVQAGFPSPAEEELLDTMSMDEFLIGKPEATYLLKVSGDSMIEAGINSGDVVVIQEQSTAQNGDIVVALIEGEEATLKTFRRRGSTIALEAANPAYETRLYQEHQVQVQGKLVGLIRSY